MTTSDPAPEAQDEAPAPEADKPDASEPTEKATASREAAKYRTQLREVEAERDTLRGQLTTWQRSQAQSVVEDILGDTSDLWRDGLDVADLLDGAGLIDPAKAKDAAQVVAKAHPTWVRRLQAPPKPNHLKSGAASGEAPSDTGWAAVIGSERRR